MTNRFGFVMVGLVVAKDVVLIVKQERIKRLKRTAMATTILLWSQLSIINMSSPLLYTVLI